MHEEGQRILLDQNIPQALSDWLKGKLPEWEIQHVNELGFQGKTDEFLYLWAQKKSAIMSPTMKISRTPVFIRLDITMELSGYVCGQPPLSKPKMPLSVL